MSLILLALAAFVTSTLTAVVGLGGGVVLLLLMPGLMPLAAILPVHAVVQFVSNGTRVGFAVRHVSIPILLPVALGSGAGALVGGQAADFFSLDWLPAVAGILILCVTWLPGGLLIPGGRWAFFWLGVYQTGLGMLAGTVGPLGAALFSRMKRGREWLVVNTAAYMTISHALRVVAFALMGFAFAPWWQAIAVMSVASIVGSWVGTALRQKVPPRNFAGVFRWVITILAGRMIWLTVAEMIE